MLTRNMIDAVALHLSKHGRSLAYGILNGSLKSAPSEYPHELYA